MKLRPRQSYRRFDPNSRDSRDSRDEQDSYERSPRDSTPEPTPKAKAGQVTKAFGVLWEQMFSSPVHLDSALSKQAKNLKSILARILPSVLLRPASQAEALGIGVPEGEPWNLDGAKIARWRPAALMAERMYEGMTQRPVTPDPSRDDFPPLLLEAWERDWGAAGVRHLVDTLAREAPLSLRAAKKTGAENLLKALKEENLIPVKAMVSDFAPLGVRLAGYAPVLGTDVYKKGGFEIQDEGSQVMALFALWPERFAPLLMKTPGAVDPGKLAAPDAPLETLPAWTVVDACAGAGGKSLAIADAMGGKGRIYSYDTSEKKLQALRRRATHAGYNNIQAVAVKEGNEQDTLKRFRKTAQVVLVDAPCSGWGVLRRNPDIKWRQNQDTLERMPVIQKRLLATYSELVAPGGRLVFGVCTFRPEETSAIVDAFLAEHPAFKRKQGGYLGPGPCDGFFMQAFERTR